MFQRAERKKAKLRLSLSGSSGSGKTWSSLEIATGMGGRIAMISTEFGRGELYGSEFVYDVLELRAPYSPDRYIAAIKDAEKAGYDILIIDSLSHAWAGEGGVLQIAEQGGGQFQNGWRKATPKHNALVEAIVTSGLHIILTMRSKTEYVVESNDKGKQAPRKVGLAPIQRDGLEYEMTIAMDINQEHIAHVSKDNTRLFDGSYLKPDAAMGGKIMEWLNTGSDALEVDPNELILAQRDLLKTKMANALNVNELKTFFAQAYRLHNGELDRMKDLVELKDQRVAQLEQARTGMVKEFHQEWDGA